MVDRARDRGRRAARQAGRGADAQRHDGPADRAADPRRPHRPAHRAVAPDLPRRAVGGPGRRAAARPARPAGRRRPGADHAGRPRGGRRVRRRAADRAAAARDRRPAAGLGRPGRADRRWPARTAPRTHLDGARLLESLPHYGRPAAEVAALFDSVYLSLYKGLGGISGCLLAGEEQLVAEAREWRHRHGGTLFELWPYAAAGLAGLRLRGPADAGVRRARARDRGRAGDPGRRAAGARPAGDQHDARLPARRRPSSWTPRSAGSPPSAGCGPGRRPSTSELPGWQVVELTVGDATLEFEPAEVRALVAEILAG